jgi:hypothetical protein
MYTELGLQLGIWQNRRLEFADAVKFQVEGEFGITQEEYFSQGFCTAIPLKFSPQRAQREK